jgi:hypothetical protein
VKSSLKREVTQDPIKAAYRIEALEAELAAAEARNAFLEDVFKNQKEAVEKYVDVAAENARLLEALEFCATNDFKIEKTQAIARAALGEKK